MAHLLAINVPVKRDPAWSDWAKMTRAKIKSAGIPVSKWQLNQQESLSASGNCCITT